MSQNLKEPLHRNVLIPFSGLDLHCFSDFQVPLTWQSSTGSGSAGGSNTPEICHRPGDMLAIFNRLVVGERY